MDIALRLAHAPFAYILNGAQRLAKATVPHQDAAAQRLFRVAALGTVPACCVHLYFRLQQVAHHLHPEAPLANRALYIMRMVLWGALAPLALPAIPLRWLATRLEAHPFVRFTAPHQLISNGNLPSFSCLTFNIGMIRSGHLISDTGVLPDWFMRRNAEDQISTRFDDVVSVLKTNPTDLICLSEVFHTSVATSFSEELGKKGYHTCHSMGRKPMAPGSGLFFASKFPIQEFTFTPFPPEAKTPRARPAGQGWYEAKVDLGGGRTVTVIGTHLSSSHKPDEPTEVELNARTRAMTLLANRVTDLGKRVILTGDLNLGPEEGHYYEHTFWKEKNLFTTDKNPDIENQPTWMGDKCYSEVASAPVRLDFTKVGVGAGFGNTHVIEVSYNPHRLDPTSVSDHRPIHTLVELS